MIQVGDTVLYGADGVCRVSGIEEKRLDGQARQYFVLIPLQEKNTIHYVPIDNEKAVAQLRPVLSAEEIHCLIRSMPDEEGAWVADDTTRRERDRQALASGDRTALVRMIKSLYRRRQEQKAVGRKLHIADERLLQEAEKRLYEEFAHVLRLSPEEVVPFIMEQMEQMEQLENRERMEPLPPWTPAEPVRQT
ncbi:MAG: CarD family transcriptional regulator [Oscillospiraceae bacterium]|jgi:CarD family transcriptional regulator|nr:CarD family transcriptional regulator [Oscillospiraceae bacterium]